MKKQRIYPLTIITDRYRGIYTNGAILAFNKRFTEIDPRVIGDDLDCRLYDPEEKVGLGNTIEEAVADLERKLGIPGNDLIHLDYAEDN